VVPAHPDVHCAGHGLQIAPGHVQPAAIAKDHLHRLVLRDMRGLWAERHHQLHLVVQVLGAGWIGHVLARLQHRMGRFGEVERRLTIDGMAHFSGMGGVVAPDTENPPDRKAPLPGDRQYRGGWRGKNRFVHHNPPS
jgi:hypothetical protein